jgi:hypothetical protein
MTHLGRSSLDDHDLDATRERRHHPASRRRQEDDLELVDLVDGLAKLADAQIPFWRAVSDALVVLADEKT